MSIGNALYKMPLVIHVSDFFFSGFMNIFNERGLMLNKDFVYLYH